MLKKIFALSVLSAIILVSLTGVVNASPGMLTYTNKEYVFSIEYPKNWTVDGRWAGESFKYSVPLYIVMFREPVEDDIISVNVETALLSRKITSEEYIKEYIKAAMERLPEELNIIKTFRDTINGESVAGYIITRTREGGEFKLMLACFVSNSTAYIITSGAPSSAYNAAEDNYFNPIVTEL